MNTNEPHLSFSEMPASVLGSVHVSDGGDGDTAYGGRSGSARGVRRRTGGRLRRVLASSPACSLSICLALAVVVDAERHHIPAARLDRVASPVLSMSLLLVTEYSVVPDAVLMVTLLVPTAVTVPDRSRAPPCPPL